MDMYTVHVGTVYGSHRDGSNKMHTAFGYVSHRIRLRVTLEPCAVRTGFVYDLQRLRIRSTQKPDTIHIGTVSDSHKNQIRCTSDSCTKQVESCAIYRTRT
eukprot:2863235-Pyramimonas_sp.AAC.1